LHLVDTSVSIGYMRGEENEGTNRLVEIEGCGHPFGITGVIQQAILQGAASRAK